MTRITPQFGFDSSQYSPASTSNKSDEQKTAQRRWDRNNYTLGNPGDMFNSMGAGDKPDQDQGSDGFKNMLDGIETENAYSSLKDPGADIDATKNIDSLEDSDDSQNPFMLIEHSDGKDKLSSEASGALRTYGDSERILQSVIFNNAHNATSQSLNYMA